MHANTSTRSALRSPHNVMHTFCGGAGFHVGVACTAHAYEVEVVDDQIDDRWVKFRWRMHCTVYQQARCLVPMDPPAEAKTSYIKLV